MSRRTFMFRRLVCKILPKFGVAALALLLNLRVPFLKLYIKLSVAALALLLVESAAFTQDLGPPCTTGCATCATAGCQHFHCPPALKWCMEGKPRICWMHG